MNTGEESQPPPGFDFSPRNIYPERQRVEAEVLRRKQELEEKKGELERSIETMRAAMGAFPDGILLTDIEGRITSFNPKLLQMWELESEAIDGKNVSDFVEAVGQLFSYPDELTKAMGGLPTGDSSETCQLFWLADGRAVECSSSPHMVRDENVGRVWVFRDVTESRRTMEALETRSAFDATILDLAPIGILMVNGDLVLTYANAKGKALLGWSELSGQRLIDAMKGVWPSDWVDRFANLVQDTLHPGKPVRVQVSFQVEGHSGRYDCEIQRTMTPTGQPIAVCYVGATSA